MRPLLEPVEEDGIASLDWPSLTRIPTKRELYHRETYFREGLCDAEDVFGARLAELVRESALIMLKPDGLVAGKLGPVTDFLRQHGFSVAGVRELRFDGFRWRELWRYQLTSATFDRLLVNDLVLRSGPALLLLLRSEGERDLPATVRLSTLKGSATLSRQQPGTLRHLLGQPNRVLSHVHVADEPADLLRELGLLFDREERRTLLAGLAGGRLTGEDEQVLAGMLDRYGRPRHTLDAAGALERVTRAVKRHAAGGADPCRAGRVIERLESMAGGGHVDWRAFQEDFGSLGVSVDRWDLAVLGTGFIVCDEPGFAKILGNPDPESWRQPPSGSPATAAP